MALFAVLAPLMLGAKSCFVIPHAESINTFQQPGELITGSSGTSEGPPCGSDPFGLTGESAVRSHLRLWVGNLVTGIVPAYVGPTTDNAWWYWETPVGWAPARLTVREGVTEGGLPFDGYYWTTDYAPDPVGCLANREQPCMRLFIEPEPNIAGSHKITAGYFIPATGAGCWNVWRRMSLFCHDPNPSTAPDPWWVCWLPLSNLAAAQGPGI